MHELIFSSARLNRINLLYQRVLFSTEMFTVVVLFTQSTFLECQVKKNMNKI